MLVKHLKQKEKVLFFNATKVRTWAKRTNCHRCRCMIGGGIFSVLGLAVDITGNATPIAFLLGGLLALVMGYFYVKLAVAFHSDGLVSPTKAG